MANAAQTTNQKVTCQICGHEDFYLEDHLLEEHNLSVEQYLAQHPESLVISPALEERFESERDNRRRSGPPALQDLSIQFAGVQFPVNTDVLEDDCLPMPDNFRCPQHGKLGRDVRHAAVSFRAGRSIRVWGLQGAGKDAFFSAISASCRIPTELFQVQPGVDIQSWFFTRAFDSQGTGYEEGSMLRCLRDGYTTTTGRTIPYMIVITDFDRADRAQAESMRLVMDSIQGRVKGPNGVTYKVFPGTQIVVTMNSSGAGDTRGRCISANPIDSSILDRFERAFEFHWMDWRDEGEIVKAKFPTLLERMPEVFTMIGRATGAIREAIYNEELYAEFSHRALCSWLGHTEDMLLVSNSSAVPANLLKQGARAWLDGLPDEETRLAAKRLIDPHLQGGMVDEGDDSHYREDENLEDGWA